MSPRVLRDTDCRRQLFAGHTNEEVSSRLGLTSQRTCTKARVLKDPDGLPFDTFPLSKRPPLAKIPAPCRFAA
jgi:hypothetical protein